jgi:hypothetical protein
MLQAKMRLNFKRFHTLRVEIRSIKSLAMRRCDVTIHFRDGRLCARGSESTGTGLVPNIDPDFNAILQYPRRKPMSVNRRERFSRKIVGSGKTSTLSADQRRMTSNIYKTQ